MSLCQLQSGNQLHSSFGRAFRRNGRPDGLRQSLLTVPPGPSPTSPTGWHLKTFTRADVGRIEIEQGLQRLHACLFQVQPRRIPGRISNQSI
jgi:hypothetical protein